jgi:hypothetical protein
MRKNSNISNYHYRSEKRDENGDLEVKYYYTLRDICNEYNTSTFTIYRMIKGDITPRSSLLKDVKFFKDYQPAYIKVKNELY